MSSFGASLKWRFLVLLSALSALNISAFTVASGNHVSRKIHLYAKKNAPDEMETYKVTTVQDLSDYFEDKERRFRKKGSDEIDYDALVKALSVEGDTQIIGSKEDTDFVHPVLELIHERRRNKSPLTPTGEKRPDGRKVALVVEGGGMRGCITAGMVGAIYHLGLEDTFDVIYGSSAGTVIGAYFNTRQLPWFGPEVYYDSLTTSGKRFIDTKRLLRTLGLGMLDPRLLKDVILRSNNGKPVLDLDFLLVETMQQKKKLDWETFVEMQKVQPLKIVASALDKKESVVFDMANGGFSNIKELAGCMRGSCLIPGFAGPIVNHDPHGSAPEGKGKKYFFRNNIKEPGVEPLADSLVFEPLPHRTAFAEGATDVLVLRSKPDGSDVTGKSSIFEKLIFKRYFKKKNKLPCIHEYMRKHGQRKIYAELVLELNEASKSKEKSDEQLMAIAVEPGSPEIARLELRRSAIFDGVRRGFARAYDSLVEDPNERGRGAIVAKQVLPDEILDYDPLEIDSTERSAFELFLEQKEAAGEGYDLPSFTGKTAEKAGLPR